MMHLGRITTAVITQFRAWDRASRAAFILALVLLVAVLVLGGRVPSDQRTVVWIGLIGLLVVMQGIFLYANRHMVTDVTRAQRMILAGDYAAAVALLEPHRLAEKPDPRALVLLGNAYRMLGDMTQSLEILTKAVQIAPHLHFARYSIGRTLMANGQYPEAADAFDAALERGAPDFAKIDLAEAQMRAGFPVIDVSVQDGESHVTLMAALIAWKGGGPVPAVDLIERGLGPIARNAERFAHTPYGVALQADVDALNALLVEGVGNDG